MTEGRGEELREILRELDQAVERAEEVDPVLERRLREVMADLQRVVGPEEDEGAEEERSLQERLADLVMDFELSHPTLSETLNRTTHLLASLGI